MTVEAFSSLPLQAGGAVAAGVGRTVLWAISAYMRQPLRNTALAALIGLCAMAGSNALYKQAHHHPAPLFGTFSAQKATVKTHVAPVMPAARPKKLTLTKTSAETTGSVAPGAVVNSVIGSADVMEVQRKLQAFDLFAGTVDGIFGPRTARSIKAFEQMIGRTPKGLLTPELIELIKATPVAAQPAKLAVTAVTLEAAPSAKAVSKAEPLLPLALVEPIKPLPAPAPLSAGAPNKAVPAAPVPQLAVPADGMTRVAPAPAPALAIASNAAENAVDPAAGGVETLATTNPAPVPKRTVQTVAVKAASPAPTQTMPAELAPPAEGMDVAGNVQVVAAVQRGLSSLGFLHGEIDGVAGEATAKAIRNFEVYYNYDVTGRVTPELVNLLVQSGAAI